MKVFEHLTIPQQFSTEQIMLAWTAHFNSSKSAMQMPAYLEPAKWKDPPPIMPPNTVSLSEDYSRAKKEEQEEQAKDGVEKSKKPSPFSGITLNQYSKIPRYFEEDFNTPFIWTMLHHCNQLLKPEDANSELNETHNFRELSKGYRWRTEWSHVIPYSEEWITGLIIWLRENGVISMDHWTAEIWRRSYRNCVPTKKLLGQRMNFMHGGFLLMPTRKCLWRMCLLAQCTLFDYNDATKKDFTNFNVNDLLANWHKRITRETLESRTLTYHDLEKQKLVPTEFFMGQAYLDEFGEDYSEDELCLLPTSKETGKQGMIHIYHYIITKNPPDEVGYLIEDAEKEVIISDGPTKDERVPYCPESKISKLVSKYKRQSGAEVVMESDSIERDQVGKSAKPSNDPQPKDAHRGALDDTIHKVEEQYTWTPGVRDGKKLLPQITRLRSTDETDDKLLTKAKSEVKVGPTLFAALAPISTVLMNWATTRRLLHDERENYMVANQEFQDITDTADLFLQLVQCVMPRQLWEVKLNLPKEHTTCYRSELPLQKPHICSSDVRKIHNDDPIDPKTQRAKRLSSEELIETWKERYMCKDKMPLGEALKAEAERRRCSVKKPVKPKTEPSKYAKSHCYTDSSSLHTDSSGQGHQYISSTPPSGQSTLTESGSINAGGMMEDAVHSPDTSVTSMHSMGPVSPVANSVTAKSRLVVKKQSPTTKPSGSEPLSPGQQKQLSKAPPAVKATPALTYSSVVRSGGLGPGASQTALKSSARQTVPEQSSDGFTTVGPKRKSRGAAGRNKEYDPIVQPLYLSPFLRIDERSTLGSKANRGYPLATANGTTSRVYTLSPVNVEARHFYNMGDQKGSKLGHISSTARGSPINAMDPSKANPAKCKCWKDKHFANNTYTGSVFGNEEEAALPPWLDMQAGNIDTPMSHDDVRASMNALLEYIGDLVLGKQVTYDEWCRKLGRFEASQKLRYQQGGPVDRELGRLWSEVQRFDDQTTCKGHCFDDKRDGDDDSARAHKGRWPPIAVQGQEAQIVQQRKHALAADKKKFRDLSSVDVQAVLLAKRLLASMTMDDPAGKVAAGALSALQAKSSTASPPDSSDRDAVKGAYPPKRDVYDIVRYVTKAVALRCRCEWGTVSGEWEVTRRMTKIRVKMDKADPGWADLECFDFEVPDREDIVKKVKLWASKVEPSETVDVDLKKDKPAAAGEWYLDGEGIYYVSLDGEVYRPKKNHR